MALGLIVRAQIYVVNREDLISLRQLLAKQDWSGFLRAILLMTTTLTLLDSGMGCVGFAPGGRRGG